MNPAQLEIRYRSAIVKSDKIALCNTVTSKIIQNKSRYEAVAESVHLPWWVIGIIHSLESGCNFNTHLHNGDPLTARTTHVPKGRPAGGNPPFTWEYSAIDALHTDRINPESIGTILDSLERYNGLGYRQGGGQGTTPPNTSPYLWSMTDQYVKGKYVADNEFDPNAVSQQVGAAAIMKILEMRGYSLLEPINPTAQNVGWFEVHALPKGELYELGIAAKIGGTDVTFATARFSCDTALQKAFFDQFPNARNRVVAPPDKPWPGDDPSPVDNDQSWTGLRKFTRGADVQLTKNFHLSEFECRCGCPHTVLRGEQIAAMQRFRDALNAPIHITSGYRCEKHNKAVGGASHSQHLTGNACDVVVEGLTPSEVFAKAAAFFNGRGKYVSFTHVDSRAEEATW